MKERTIAAKEVLDVQFLREGDSACRAVTFDTDLKYPVEVSFVIGGVVGSKIANEICPERGVIVDEDAVVDP